MESGSQASPKDAPIFLALEKRIQDGADAKEWARLRARQGLYLTRTAASDEAAGIPDEIRARFAGRESPDVFFWVWLLEGVSGFFRTATAQDLDRILRAHAAACTLGDRPLQQYAAAWAAHLCFAADDFAGMARWLAASGLHQAELPEAACRACLVVAAACQTAGDDRGSTVWHGRAREIARALGDRASLIASVENRAIMRLNRLWVRGFLGDFVASELREVEIELLGGQGYERATGTEAMAAEAPVLRARIEVLKGRHAAALKQLESMRSTPHGDDPSVVRAAHVMKPWLQWKDGRRDEALAGLAALDPGVIDALHDDDAAVCWKMMHDLDQALHGGRRSADYLRRSDAAHGRHRACADSLLDVLKSGGLLQAPESSVSLGSS